MARSGHVAEIRALVGTHPLLLPSVGTAVFDDERADARLLLVRHADGTHGWGLPGGAIEPGEHPADAAVREVHEETGLLVEITGLAGVFGGPEAEIRYDNGDRTTYVTTLFVARPRGGATGAELSPARDEVHAADWFAVDDLDDLALPAHAAAMVAVAVGVHRDGSAPRFEPARWRPGTAGPPGGQAGS